MRYDPEYDGTMHKIQNEEARALAEHGRLLRAQAVDAIARSRKLREHSAAFAACITQFLERARR